MLFDFKSYLQVLDPWNRYTIQPLTGGIVNVTVRATKYETERGSKVNSERNNDDSSDNNIVSTSRGDKFPGYNSLVLKYAPPFIAAVGPEAPFDVYRQTIEARALDLLASPSKSILGNIPRESTVLLPESLLHDTSANVLIISDLGPLENLSDHFRGYLASNVDKASIVTNEDPFVSNVVEDKSRVDTQAYYQSIGQRLGHFFALLHSPATLKRLDEGPGDHTLPENPGMKSLVFTEAIEPLKEHLLKFPDLLEPTEAEALYERIEKNFWRDTPYHQQSFVLGDCWTGAILIEPPSNKAPSDPMNASQTKVAVIDWEFASRGRGVDGDMSQLLCHLQQFLTFAKYRGNVEMVSAVKALMNGLIESYGRISIRERSPWTGSTTSHQYENYKKSKDGMLTALTDDQATVFRSFMISHAAEMINCAFWKEWNCGPTCCGKIYADVVEAIPGSEMLSTQPQVGSPNRQTSISPDGTPQKSESVRGTAELGSPVLEAKTDKKEDCKLIRLFMENAIGYLRRACQNIPEFSQETNLREIVDLPLGLGEGILSPFLTV